MASAYTVHSYQNATNLILSEKDIKVYKQTSDFFKKKQAWNRLHQQ